MRRVCVLCIALFVACCSRGESARPASEGIRDSRGKIFTQSYTRVISLAPNMTEIFCWLAERYNNAASGEESGSLSMLLALYPYRIIFETEKNTTVPYSAIHGAYAHVASLPRALYSQRAIFETEKSTIVPFQRLRRARAKTDAFAQAILRMAPPGIERLLSAGVWGNAIHDEKEYLDACSDYVYAAGGKPHTPALGGEKKSIQPKTQAKLIAVSEQCDWPESIRNLPRAGSMLMPDYERILRLRPDMVLASYEGNPPGLEAVLARADIPLYVARVDSLAALYTTLTNMSLLFFPGRDMVWERELAENLRALRGAFAKERIFFQIGDTDQAWSFGKKTLLHDLITLAGAENLGAGRAGSFPQFDSEALSRLTPDVVILLTESNAAADTAFWKRYAPKAKLLRAAPDRFERPGPRMAEALREIL